MARVRLLLVARWILWLMVIWIAVRGVASIVVPSAVRVPTEGSATVQRAPINTEGARVYAALFAREYLAWQGNGGAERAARLKPFLASHLDASGGLALRDQESSQSVTDAWPWGLKELTPERAQVTVVIDVTVISSGKKSPQHRRIGMVVPVALAGGGFIVYDYPTFVPLQPPGQWQGSPFSGTPVADAVAPVRELLSGFLRAYMQGAPAELAYFLTPGVRLNGLGGEFLYKELKEVEVLQTGTEHWAVAQVLVEDPVSGASFRQRFLVKLAQRDRWYVEDIQQKGEWNR